MQRDVIVKKSKIDKKGVFAARDFKKGETVIIWKPKILSRIEAEKAPSAQEHFIVKDGREYLLMHAPEKYVNHSCGADTRVRGRSDVAVRNIKKGEEITSCYKTKDCQAPFECRCGAKKCRGIIGKAK